MVQQFGWLKLREGTAKMNTEETSNIGKGNWSSSFARARTELIVATVIILAMTHLDMNLSRIPGFGIELEHGAPRATILAFLLLFFVYFLVVFLVKYLAEYRDVQLPTDILRKLETRLKEHVSALQSLPQPAHDEAINLHVSQLHRSLDKYKEATFTRYGHLAAHLPQRWAIGDHNRIDEMDLQNALAKVGTPLDEQNQATTVRTIQAAITQAKRFNDLRYENEVKQLESAAEAHLVSVRADIEGLKLNLEGQISQIQSDIAAQANDVKPILSAIQVDIDKIRRETRDLARAFTWDKIVFGFWVPLIFALTSIGFSTPQAIADMEPLMARITQCLPPSKQQCWYREPQNALDRTIDFFRQLNSIAR
ncbi:hypothetical protein [Ciceribacter selenitireducens]